MAKSDGDQAVPPGLAQWVQSDAAKLLSSRFDDALSTPGDLDPDDLDELVAAVADVAAPAPKVERPRPRPVAPTPPPQLPDWAADHQLQTPAESVELPPLQPMSDHVAGGVADLSEFAAQLPDDLADDDESSAFTVDADAASRPAQRPEWDTWGLWTRPAREPVVVPDDVDSITPVSEDDLAADEAASRGESASARADGGPGDVDEALTNTSARSLSAAWSMLPSWTRIALPCAGALVVVLALLVVISGGNSSPTPAVGPPPMPVAPQTSAARVDGPLIPKDVQAPDCPAGSSPDPTGAFDGDKRTAWICARRYGIDYAILTIIFAEPVVITGIDLTPGFDYVEPNGEDHWNQHRLVTNILWRIGGHPVPQPNIVPNRSGVHLAVRNIATTVMTATIQGTERPPAAPTAQGGLPGLFNTGPDKKVDDTFAIGRIEITGYPAGGQS